jgi:hypothetical protein
VGSDVLFLRSKRDSGWWHIVKLKIGQGSIVTESLQISISHKNTTVFHLSASKNAPPRQPPVSMEEPAVSEFASIITRLVADHESGCPIS